MSHKEAKYQSNVERLKANELSLVWELENDPYVDMSIKHISGQVFVSDHILKYNIDEWLDDNIIEAICVSKGPKEGRDGILYTHIFIDEATDIDFENLPYEKITNEPLPPGIDNFLDQLKLPNHREASEFYLRLHVSYREKLYEDAKIVSGHTGRFTRYRGYLLLFDEDIPETFMCVGFIFDEICRLKILQANNNRWFSQKEFDTLKYLQHNRYKSD